MPKPFFTKLVAISAIGFFCVLFGCIFGIATHDRLFILMSLLIGICSILRALSFYHLIHTHAYLSLDVSCTKREQTLFGKNQQYWFASALYCIHSCVQLHIRIIVSVRNYETLRIARYKHLACGK